MKQRRDVAAFVSVRLTGRGENQSFFLKDKTSNFSLWDECFQEEIKQIIEPYVHQFLSERTYVAKEQYFLIIYY